MGRKLWLFLIALLLGALGVLLMPKGEGIRFQCDTSAPTPRDAMEPPPETITLPHTPEELNLVVETLFAYEGEYIEDGSFDLVDNVAGVILHNTGHRGISFVTLALRQGSKTTYFTATWLPPGEKVLVLAMERGEYSREPITECRILGIRWDSFDSAPVAVETADNGIAITNLSGETVTGVRLRYKWYMQEYGFFFGGITHSTAIPSLKPGESCLIYPENYGPETARVVAKIK